MASNLIANGSRLGQLPSQVLVATLREFLNVGQVTRCQKSHHVIKLVHFAGYTAASGCQGRRRVELLLQVAIAGGVGQLGN